MKIVIEKATPEEIDAFNKARGEIISSAEDSNLRAVFIALSRAVKKYYQKQQSKPC